VLIYPSEKKSVMISERGNKNGIILDLVGDAVFIGDAAGPVSGEVVFEGFRFAVSRRRHALSSHSMNGIKMKKQRDNYNFVMEIYDEHKPS
jgi:hypothetical protein